MQKLRMSFPAHRCHYVPTLQNLQELRHADPADSTMLVSVLEGACADWREHGRPFWAFLALPDDQFDALQN